MKHVKSLEGRACIA